MFIIIMKNMTNNKMYTVQELHIFQDHSKTIINHLISITVTIFII